MGIVVYTAIMGGFDLLRKPRAKGEAEWCAFLDHAGGKWESGVDGWDVTIVPTAEDPRRKARYYKTLAHRHFPDAEAWVWVDGSIIPTVPPKVLVEEMLGDADFAAFRHPGRNCAYEEAKRCIVKGKDKRELLEGQMAAYRAAGFPANWGLVETGLIVRRNCEAVRRLNELWWEQIVQHSCRDQVSLPYVLWQTGVRARVMEGSLIRHKWVDFSPHKGAGR